MATHLLLKPRVAAMPSKEWPGADTLGSEVLPLELLKWNEAWIREWDSDAHFVCYLLGTGSAEEMPRCNKRVLPHLRDAGADLHTRVLALDYDLPGHAEWTEEGLNQWLDQMMAIGEEWPLGWQWSVLYTTQHGARLVYLLDRAMPVDEAEGYHRWLVVEWLNRGIEMDARCSDWTRLFRLPKVVRDKQKTWETDYFQLVQQPEATLCVGELGTITNPLVRRKGKVKEFNLPKPGADIGHTLLTEVSDAGNAVYSAWLKKAKIRLRNRACYPCVFGHEALAHEGRRHNTMLKFVGEATTLLFGLEIEDVKITTPQHIYALFLEPALQLEPDNDTPDWTETLWTQVLYCWANEDAEGTQREEEKQQQEEDALKQLGRIVRGMREWCDHPALMGSDLDAKSWAMRHLIAVAPRGSYLMRPDGWYDSLSTTTQSLVPRVRSLGMDGLIQTQVPSGEGMRWLKGQEIINEYGTAVGSISGKPQTKGAYITDIDTSSSNLHVRLYGRRTDIDARYDGRVDEWLRRLFGSHYKAGCNWLGWSLAFEEGPIAALSLQGAAGAGKKMLAYGLAECVDTQSLAQADDLVSGFQPGLLRSPFLLVDEGWPARSGGKHPADMFRELVGGSTRHVNTKFRDPVQCTNPVRVIFTANDLNVVRMLSQDRDLSPEDREALGIRLMHVDICHQATFWLRANGGEKFTRGWIAGDGGGGSDYVVARHFLWCYENKRLPRQNRLLVEGNSTSHILTDLRTQSGSAPVVIEAIIRMVEIKNKLWPGLAVEDNRLYVLSSQVLTFWRDELKSSSARLTLQKVGQVMRGLVNAPTVARRLNCRQSQGRKSWHEVDCRVLLECAQKDGWNSTALAELVRQQQAAGILYKSTELERLDREEADVRAEVEAASASSETESAGSPEEPRRAAQPV